MGKTDNPMLAQTQFFDSCHVCCSSVRKRDLFRVFSAPKVGFTKQPTQTICLAHRMQHHILWTFLKDHCGIRNANCASYKQWRGKIENIYEFNYRQRKIDIIYLNLFVCHGQ